MVPFFLLNYKKWLTLLNIALGLLLLSALAGYFGAFEQTYTFIVWGLCVLLILFQLSIYNREKEKIFTAWEVYKFDLLEEDVKNRFGNIQDSEAFFTFIDDLKAYMRDNYSRTNLFAVEVVGLLNKSVEHYIYNLELIAKQKKMLSMVSEANKQWYKDEIEKNRQQNRDIITNLEKFLQDVIQSQNNDAEMARVRQEYNEMMDLYHEVSANRSKERF